MQGYIVRREGKKGVTYQARYRGPDRKIHSQSFERKKDAERFLSEQHAKVGKREWIDPRALKTPLNDVIEQWKAKRKPVRPSTLARDDAVIRTHLEPRFGMRPVGEIAWQEIEDMRDQMLKSGLAPATVTKTLTILSQILKHSQKYGFIPTNPCDFVDSPGAAKQRKEIFLTAEELNALAGAVDPRFHALVLLGGYRGLRFGELAGLKETKVNLLAAKLEVAEILCDVKGKLFFGPPKTEEGKRAFTLPKFLVEVLEEHLSKFPPKNGLIFTNGDGSMLRASNFRRRTWNPAVRTSLAEEKQALTPHGLRHTAVSLLIVGGASMVEIGGILGWSKHSIPAMSARYGHLYESRDQELAERTERMYRESAHNSRTNPVLEISTKRANTV